MSNEKAHCCLQRPWITVAHMATKLKKLFLVVILVFVVVFICVVIVEIFGRKSSSPQDGYVYTEGESYPMCV